MSPAQRTYWHLADLGRVPSAYDIGTSRLLYYPERGFEVATPVARFYARYQAGSRLALSPEAAERFRDPRETTYAKYVELSRWKENFVDGLLGTLDDTSYDKRLSAGWVRTLGQVLGVMRYPVHALQMVAGYVGSMAPGGRIVVTCALQAADEMRRIQRLAYRLRQLQDSYPGLGDDARARWQEDPVWQPLRRLIEQLLVTYDWGEALVALALVVAPAVDELLLVKFARQATRHHDEVLAKSLGSLAEDSAWHRDWAAALVKVAIEHQADNARVIQEWRARWAPRAEDAVAALAPLFDEAHP
jgi:toluene monooxygenase system protein E